MFMGVEPAILRNRRVFSPLRQFARLIYTKHAKRSYGTDRQCTIGSVQSTVHQTIHFGHCTALISRVLALIVSCGVRNKIKEQQNRSVNAINL
jgi:hypothetical protein